MADVQAAGKPNEAQDACEQLADTLQQQAEQLREHIDLAQLRAESEILRTEFAQSRAQV